MWLLLVIRKEASRHRLQQSSIVEVERERRENWRVKLTEEVGKLAEKVMTGEAKEGGLREDLGRSGEILSNSARS